MQTAVVANTGTALMWTSGLHLLFGNALLGYLEGVLLARITNCDRRRAIVLMVVANYASAWLGAAALGAFRELLDATLTPVTLPAAPRVLLAAAVGAYLFTVVVEAPFCLLAVRKGPGRLVKDLRGCVLVQTASYVLILAPLYFLASETSLYTQGDLRDDLSFVQPPIATVYFINPRDGDVWQIDTDGRHKAWAHDADVYNHFARLFVTSGDEPNVWNLHVVGRGYGEWFRLEEYVAHDGGTGSEGRHRRHVRLEKPEAGLLVRNFARGQTETEIQQHNRQGWGPMSVDNTWSNTGPAFDLRHGTSTLNVETDLWFFLDVSDKEKRLYRLGLETPFLSWCFRNVTILPNEQAVLQIGDQIAILDLGTRALGVLAAGRGPVVMIPEH